MKKKVAVIHTFLYSVEDLKKLFSEKLPGVEMINIIDDSLLQEALSNKGITPGIIRRICTYAREAETMGVDCILNQCSSMGEAVNIARRMVTVPYVKIDEPMADKAVSLGSSVAVIATAISTVEPSSKLVEECAAKINKQVKVNRCFVEGAYEALLIENNRDKHNELVVNAVKKAAEENDVIVLAQGSMYHLLPLLKDVKVPVLTSLESGVEQIKKVINV